MHVEDEKKLPHEHMHKEHSENPTLAYDTEVKGRIQQANLLPKNSEHINLLCRQKVLQ